MTKITIVATLASIGLATVPAPAAAQSREQLQITAELRIVQQQQAELSLAIAQLTQTLADAMRALNARLDQTDQHVTKASADSLLGIRQMADDLRVVREGTQATGTQLGRLREEIEALRTSIPSLLTRLQPPAPVPAFDPLDPNAPPQQVPPVLPDAGVPPPPVSTLGLSPERLFNTARGDYGAGQFSVAITGFERFIQTFPDSDLVDDAQLAIGDAEVGLTRFEEAIAAYNRVIQNSPRGDAVPWAYYKRGLVERRLQRPEMARASLEMALKSAPNDAHPVAPLAKQILDGMTRTPPAPAAPQRP